MSNPHLTSPAPRRSRKWPWAIGIGTVLVIVLACGGLLTAVVVDRVRREDTPERFHRLAAIICEPMFTDGATPDKPSEAELRYLLDQEERELATLNRECDALAAVAAEQLSIVRGVRAAISHQPQTGDFVGGAALVGLGYVLGSADAAQQGARTIGEATSSIRQFLTLIDELCVRRGANQLELQRIGRRFAGPEDPRAQFSAQFFEVGVFSTSPDTLRLSNNSGKTLHNCVVSVRLKGRDGSTCSHAHFVAEWPSGISLSARYESGIFGFVRQTVSQVQTVGFAVSSSELSTGWTEISRPVGGWPETP